MDTAGKGCQPIHVTKSYLPPREEYVAFLETVWNSNQLTNGGSLLEEFEDRVKAYLGLQSFQFVANGTLALQLALSGLDIHQGEVITTPFSYVATTNAILWQRCKPIFADIDPLTFNLDPRAIEPLITKDTKAIMPVHVFGNPCDIEEIEKVAKAYGLKVIFDAAHAFGVGYQGSSVIGRGDVSVCSFHATKVFHTIEGGGLTCADKKVDEKVELQKRFGHNAYDHVCNGINAKANEFSAAMGICNLRHFDDNIAARKQSWLLYQSLLPNVQKQTISKETVYNYGYFPLVFKEQAQLMKVLEALGHEGIYPRRYFFPSLNTLPYLEGKRQSCEVSEHIAERILCLPLWSGMDEAVVHKVSWIVDECL